MLNGTSEAISLDYYVGVSLDDPVYWPVTLDAVTEGKPTLSSFNTEHRYGAFGGSPMRAVLDTAESAGPEGGRWFINSVRPVVDVQSNVVEAQIIRRDQLMGGGPIYEPPVIQEITGECPVLADSRYLRVRIIVPEGAYWSSARGVELFRKSTGRI
jgi:hypothetical protein